MASSAPRFMPARCARPITVAHAAAPAAKRHPSRMRPTSPWEEPMRAIATPANTRNGSPRSQESPTNHFTPRWYVPGREQGRPLVDQRMCGSVAPATGQRSGQWSGIGAERGHCPDEASWSLDISERHGSELGHRNQPTRSFVCPEPDRGHGFSTLLSCQDRGGCQLRPVRLLLRGDTHRYRLNRQHAHKFIVRRNVLERVP